MDKNGHPPKADRFSRIFFSHKAKEGTEKQSALSAKMHGGLVFLVSVLLKASPFDLVRPCSLQVAQDRKGTKFFSHRVHRAHRGFGWFGIQ